LKTLVIIEGVSKMQKLLPWMLNKKIIENITPKFRFDGSLGFEEWQREGRAKLTELLGLKNIVKPADDKFTVEYEKECDNYTEIRFTVQSEEGYFCPAVMLIPKGIKAPAPTMLCLQGHSTGMHISLARIIHPKDEKSIAGGDRDFAIRAVKEGCVAVAREQRNFGECGAKESGEPDCHVSSMTALLSGRTTIGERVHDVSCIIDAILAHFEFVDKERVMLMGNSGGGTATVYAAAIDERISLAMPSCSVCTYKSSIAAMFHCVCNFVPNIANYFDMGELGGLIAPRALVVVNGREDEIFPEEGVEEAFSVIKSIYKAAGAENRCRLVTGDGGHICYPDITWSAFEDMIAKKQ
jgi:dienelactone hydrolase